MKQLIDALRYARPAVAAIVGPQDADDVLQSAALVAWRKRKQFRRECKYTTWFYHIAVRQALMLKRKRRLEQFGDFDQIVDAAKTPEELAAESERDRRLYEAILALRPHLRSAAVRCLREEQYSCGADKAARHKMREELRRRLA